MIIDNVLQLIEDLMLIVVNCMKYVATIGEGALLTQVSVRERT
jgi:hypothetical protein